MIDFFIGRPPNMNSHNDPPSPPIQREVRELLRIFRNMQFDRRKNTKERRLLTNPNVIVDLSNRRERRAHLDRRQKQEFLLNMNSKKERRNPKPDRRKSTNDGIIVNLSNRSDRRQSRDRRTTQSYPSNTAPPKLSQAEEIRECVDAMQKIILRLQAYL